MTAMIQIRNVPDELHRKLKARAALQGKSLSDYLLEGIAEMAERPSVEEWRARLRTREPMNLGDETLEILRAEREGR
jgi:plasmid stability protein